MTKVKPKSPNRKKISWLLKQPFDVKAEMLKQHLEICRLLINELLDDEVIQLSGERYSRNKLNDGRYSRWGYNPGSVEIGDEKVRLEIPRVINTQTNQSQPLQSYEQLKTMDAINDRLMERVLLGLSTNDYAVAVKHLVDSFGLSRFIEQSESRLKEFMNRDLSQYEFVALFIDGKHLAKEQIIIVLGVTITGEKIPLGFIQTHSENAASIKALLTSLVDRGFDYEGGILCVIDGSKGIRKAVKEAFGKYALIQRCQWH
jgi:transposase-like protein